MVCVTPENDALISAVADMQSLLGRSKPPRDVVIVRIMSNGRKMAVFKEYIDESKLIKFRGCMLFDDQLFFPSLRSLVFACDDAGGIPVFCETMVLDGTYRRRLQWVDPGDLRPVLIRGQGVEKFFNPI